MGHRASWVLSPLALILLCLQLLPHVHVPAKHTLQLVDVHACSGQVVADRCDDAVRRPKRLPGRRSRGERLVSLAAERSRLLRATHQPVFWCPFNAKWRMIGSVQLKPSKRICRGLERRVLRVE